MRPLSSGEFNEIAEIRLALITLVLKPAHPHLAPIDFDQAHDLAKRLIRTKSAKEAFECNRRFWDIIFQKAERPILWEMFRKLDDRMTRYYNLLLELYPNPESRPCQHAALIEVYRKGKIAEALRAFKEIYLQMVDDVRNHLEPRDSVNPVD